MLYWETGGGKSFESYLVIWERSGQNKKTIVLGYWIEQVVSMFDQCFFKRLMRHPIIMYSCLLELKRIAH